ncbi:iron chelate uptake ABC transporter family permease subunit [Planomonospora sp. ID67723]|nr:iron chelate uptake ABC transporter family permease subunit [Planomonospora sp. ID67723]
MSLQRQTVRLPGAWTLRTRHGLSVAVRPRSALTAIAFAAVFLASGLVAFGIGNFPAPLGDVPAALLGRGDSAVVYIVQEVRLPRVLTGALVGAAFGVSGAITQSIARNPLASPDVLGVTAGASAAAVAVIVLGGETASMAGITAAALAGALATAAVVYALAWRRGLAGLRLILVGIGAAALLTSFIEYLLLRAEINDALRASVWLTGSLSGRGFEHAVPVGVALLVLVPAALALTRNLTVIRFGDDTARALGLSVERSRAALIVVAVVLAAVATAGAGPVAFVALAAPRIAIMVTRSSTVPMVNSALAGAALVVIADIAARVVLAPTELPVGIVTAALGGPCLMWLLVRANRTG